MNARLLASVLYERCMLTLQLMAEEQGLEVSLDGFNQYMNQQRERSRVSSVDCVGMNVSCMHFASLPDLS